MPIPDTHFNCAWAEPITIRDTRTAQMSDTTLPRKHVLVLDDDRDIAEMVQTILIDEGFRVSCLYDLRPTEEMQAAVARLEPDCILLDGASPRGFATSWELAEWLASRSRPVPVVMLTAHHVDREEAMLDVSARAKAARFAGAIAKPFDIDEFAAMVHKAVGQRAEPTTDSSERETHACLVEALRAAGAQELMASGLGRVWATFRGHNGDLYRIYRWRLADVYFIGRYDRAGAQMSPLGQFADLSAALTYCMGRIAPASPA